MPSISFSSPCRYFLTTLIAAAFWLWSGLLASFAIAESYDDIATPDGWAWSQIKLGQAADFSQRCPVYRFEEKMLEDVSWQNECRKLSARLIEDLLTKVPWRESVPAAGVRIKGAWIVGIIDLANAKLIRPIEIVESRLDDKLSLRRAKTDSLITLRNSLMVGQFDAPGLRSESGVDLFNSTFKESVYLDGAQIGDDFNVYSSTLDGGLQADSMTVGRDLYLESPGFPSGTSFKSVFLRGSRIKGRVVVDRVNIGGQFTLDNVQSGGELLIDKCRIDDRFGAFNLQIGSDFVFSDSQDADQVDMQFAHVGAHTTVLGSTLGQLDLSAATIGGDLRLGGLGKSVVWKNKTGQAGTLILRNTRIGKLMDATDAWPVRGHLQIDGFSFSHLGGFAGDTASDMRNRGMKWWDDWARRDPKYSPAPYAQLAAAFTSAGERDAANDARYLGRVRERENEGWLAFVWSGFLQWVAGFGIGTYTFRVLYWVIIIAFLGAIYLKTSVKGVREGNHGFVWCFGASVARLLPAIEINKEFTEFFNDPERKRFTPWQSFVFSTMGVVGWVLGAILIAAVAGLTQTS
jgi:hypothetical protein